MGFGVVGKKRSWPLGRALRLGSALGVLVLALLMVACTGSESDSGSKDESADSGDPTSSSSTPTAPPAPLQFLPTNEAVFCDGTTRTAGELRGALPGELIVLASALPIDLEQGVADDQGTYVVPWSCEPAESRLKWDVTAVGNNSGRRVAFIISGSAEDPELSNMLRIAVPDEPFICDGTRKPIGDLTGAEPFENITFRSDEVDGISDGQADASGALRLHWRCDAGEAGTTWQVRVRGVESTKTGEFTLTAARFDESALPEPTVTMLEDPFVCDGETRPVAAITGFVPREVIDFSSNDASGLIDRSADAGGGVTARWQCDRDDIGKIWQVLAEGVGSGRKVSITITGGDPPEGTYKDLAIAYTEDPFLCDGESRQFASLANFLTGEFVDFDSPDSGPLRQGQADGTGALPIRWQCEPGEEGKTWQVTATGTTSKKSITFTVTAAP